MPSLNFNRQHRPRTYPRKMDTLTLDQQKMVKAWMVEGISYSEIQTRIRKEFRLCVAIATVHAFYHSSVAPALAGAAGITVEIITRRDGQLLDRQVIQLPQG